MATDKFFINLEKCISCGLCVEDCPASIISLNKNGYPIITEEDYEKCINCQHCLAVCPTGSFSINGYDPNMSKLISREDLPISDALENLIKFRRSVRRFKHEELDKSIIDKMIDIASYSATAKNISGNHFTVVKGFESMNRLREFVMKGLTRKINDFSLPDKFCFYEEIVNQWVNNKHDIIFRNAPHLVVVSTTSDSHVPFVDSLIALSSFEHLAVSNGLGTLWVGAFNWVLNDILPETRKILSIPEKNVIGYSMLFGKPAVKYYRTAQKEPASKNYF